MRFGFLRQGKNLLGAVSRLTLSNDILTKGLAGPGTGRQGLARRLFWLAFVTMSSLSTCCTLLRKERADRAA